MVSNAGCQVSASGGATKLRSVNPGIFRKSHTSTGPWIFLPILQRNFFIGLSIGGLLGLRIYDECYSHMKKTGSTPSLSYSCHCNPKWHINNDLTVFREISYYSGSH